MSFSLKICQLSSSVFFFWRLNFLLPQRILPRSTFDRAGLKTERAARPQVSGWWSLLDIIEHNYYNDIIPYLNNLILPLRICSMGFPFFLRAPWFISIPFSVIWKENIRFYSFFLNEYFAKKPPPVAGRVHATPLVGPKLLFVPFVFGNESWRSATAGRHSGTDGELFTASVVPLQKAIDASDPSSAAR